MPIATHLSTEIEPAARGRELGRARRAELHAAFARYDELFAAEGARAGQVADWGARALAETAAWAPELAAEMTGTAEGAGLEPWQLGALNGRTEILAALAVTGEGECSAAVLVPQSGAPRTVQTWDWHDTFRDGMLLWSLEPRPGRRVHTFTEFGVVGKVGVNSDGLGLHFNVLRHASDHTDIGVPVHVVARRILDEATTVGEAVELARSARLSASTVLTVVTYDGERGDAIGLELSPERVGELPVDPDGVLLHTNHFLDEKLAAGEKTTNEVSSTFDRLPGLRERVTALNTDDRTERARALHSHRGEGPAICAHADLSLPAHLRWESLATISLDVAAGRLYAHEGGPCRIEPDGWQQVPFDEKGRV
ncbi:C45 family peptidase [Amycolatopsis sp. 195334CR]|uniref:C45 family autoproteolytic acyltransferase/hydolase n=1 Tax=Amycolatopsis sp. 195334CR TaxID=2814588 RepID=UPI001A8DB673|nr:C45 family peptidase [Amycolatopsis sp. 195334CR]MBN6041012.1 peptidase C45 [Amycolatopsis sp. 195334CR]